jgi:hypothetical protein
VREGNKGERVTVCWKICLLLCNYFKSNLLFWYLIRNVRCIPRIISRLKFASGG